VASTTILEKKLLSGPINFDDIEVLQQLYKASFPKVATLTAIFFFMNFTAVFEANLYP
jgi:hypothetical protein